MKNIKTVLKKLLTESLSKNNLFKRNLIKQYFQVIILDFIYSHPSYSKLVFYGGSCLMHCFNLPRLSEDLDFVDLNKKVKLSNLARDLEHFFQNKTDVRVTAKIQKFRIILKFPILHELGLADKSESNFLHVKIEVFQNFNRFKKITIETIPLFKYGESILIRCFDLSTLMTTKLQAIFNRKWEKTDKKGKVLISAKGRDYFDLMWYLQKGIQPNMKGLKGMKSHTELKEKLLKIVASLDSKSIQLDLESFVDDPIFVKNLSKTLTKILEREIKIKL